MATGLCSNPYHIHTYHIITLLCLQSNVIVFVYVYMYVSYGLSVLCYSPPPLEHIRRDVLDKFDGKDGSRTVVSVPPEQRYTTERKISFACAEGAYVLMLLCASIER